MINTMEIISLNIDRLSQSLTTMLSKIAPSASMDEQLNAVQALKATFQKCHDGLSTVQVKLVDIVMQLV